MPSMGSVPNSSLLISFPANGKTGDVDVNTPPVVPDGGSTVMLLGAAFGALGLARRYLMR